MKISFNRRHFIRLGLGSLAAVGFQRMQTAHAASMTSADVIVIGAGISGLRAAAQLSTAGKSVIVLEAQSQTGGRIVTSKSLGSDTPLDLGASWIHGVKGNPITGIADNLKLARVITNYDDIQRYDYDGRELTDTESDDVDTQYSALIKKVNAYRKSASIAASLESGINKAMANVRYSAYGNRAIQYAISTEIEHEYGSDIRQLSLKYWDQDGEYSGSDVIFRDGYEQITHFLAKGLDIRLNTVVTAIDWSKTNVKVTTSSGTVFNAGKVVITLPIGILKAGKIKFTPSLPSSHSAAIKRLGVGLLNKLYLKFPSIFWDNSVELLGYMADTSAHPATRGLWAEWYCFNRYTAQNILLGFNAATYAGTVENMSDADTVADAMKVLRNIYGSKIPDPTGYLLTRWGKNPYSLGAYSNLAPGASGIDYDTLALPVSKRLYFAGEHTHRTYPSTVHGAYLSGDRAASNILKDLKKT